MIESFDRNIGFITAEQQDSLAHSRVAVIGLGGLGGVIAEILTRSGVGELVLIDFDTFDRSNINRQIFAFEDTLGHPKPEVTLQFLQRINPAISVVLAKTVDEENCSTLLADCSAIVLAADDAVPCIVASRFAQEHGIPVVEGWAIPFCNVRVFTRDTPTLEECYGFPPLPHPLGQVSDETRATLKQRMLMALIQIDGLSDYYPPAALERIRAGQIPSFAPVVWFAAVRMAVETAKLLLGMGTPSLAPAFSVYDPFDHRLPAQGVA